MKAASRNRNIDLVIIDDDDSTSVPANVKVENVDGESKVAPTLLLYPSAPLPDIIKLHERVAQLEKMLQPVAPPSPPSEVAELRERLAKAERMFKKACRAAREAELRAERAEFLLDTKRGVLESTKAQLAGELNVNDLTQEKDALAEEVRAMRRNIQSMREKSNYLAGRVTALTEQLEDERSIGREQRDIYRTRIVELSKQLATPSEHVAPQQRSVRDVATQHNGPSMARQHPEAPPAKMARMEEVNAGREREHPKAVASVIEVEQLAEVNVGKRQTTKVWIPMREVDMRRALKGEPGGHALGLLLGRSAPTSSSDDQALDSSLHLLRCLVNGTTFKKSAHKLNTILNTPRFICICGANIQCAVSLFTHFNSTKHVNKRVYPVYQSDVDFWINAIDKLKASDSDSDIICLN